MCSCAPIQRLGNVGLDYARYGRGLGGFLYLGLTICDRRPVGPAGPVAFAPCTRTMALSVGPARAIVLQPPMGLAILGTHGYHARPAGHRGTAALQGCLESGWDRRADQFDELDELDDLDDLDESTERCRPDRQEAGSGRGNDSDRA